MDDAERLKRIRELAKQHPSAHPAYHKHCHLHPDDICPDCQWLAKLNALLA